MPITIHSHPVTYMFLYIANSEREEGETLRDAIEEYIFVGREWPIGNQERFESYRDIIKEYGYEESAEAYEDERWGDEEYVARNGANMDQDVVWLYDGRYRDLSETVFSVLMIAKEGLFD